MVNLEKEKEDKIVVEVHHYHHYPEQESKQTRRPGIIPNDGQAIKPTPPPAPTLRPRMVREGCAVYMLIGALGFIGAVLTLI